MSEEAAPTSEKRVATRGSGVVGALLIAVGLLMIATGVFAKTHSFGGGGGNEDLRAAATALRPRVEQALTGAARSLEPKAMTAARLPEIVSALDLDADPHTFEDLLENEDWWAPYRTEFPLSGLVTANGALAMLGSSSADLNGTAAVRQAREAGAASGVTTIQGRAFLFAAARVPRGKRHASGAIVILGTPFERSALQSVADAAGTAVALSDGKKLLATAGPDTAQTTLGMMVGREDKAPEGGVINFEDGHSGLAVPIDRSLWLDAVLPVMPGPPGGSRLGLFIGAGGMLLGAAGLAIQLSGRRRQKVDSDNPMVITRPMGSGQRPRPPTKEQIQRTKDLRPPGQAGFAPGAEAPPAAAGAPGQAVATAAVMLETPPAGPGVTLGRYRLLERIGEGGMAEIFIAAAHGAEGFVRYFVVKRMHPHLARSRDAVNQFIDEGRLQSGLVHSNIVPVFDFGRVGEEYFLALEYIHGRDLERLVRRHVEVFGRSLSVPVAFYIMHEVLEALAYAHARTDPEGRNLLIVHRDVSPGNILVSARGEVKLSDFGIAKAEGRMSKTEVGMIKGNVSFMSPEQARGETVDLRSDLFSAAVVLYYCLTAQFLYQDETMFNRLVRAAIGPAQSEFNQLGELPPMAADVLRKALSLDVGKRYQNAREFARDLAGHFTAGRSELADLMDTLFPELRREGR
ncbi:MAG TPA: serine/threonine-protein kinase [Polyangia bacterium]|nr:serine/threonine-protein kinase [Polyangia bacterium]